MAVEARQSAGELGPSRSLLPLRKDVPPAKNGALAARASITIIGHCFPPPMRVRAAEPGRIRARPAEVVLDIRRPVIGVIGSLIRLPGPLAGNRSEVILCGLDDSELMNRKRFARVSAHRVYAASGRYKVPGRSVPPAIAQMSFFPCATLPTRGEARLEGSAPASIGRRLSACLFPLRAFVGTALNRCIAPGAPSPGPLRFWFAPARQKRDVELRHAVLQAVEDLLLPETGREGPPGRPKVDRLVEVSRRLRPTPCGVRNCSSESDCGSGRSRADHFRVACENPGRITTRTL